MPARQLKSTGLILLAGLCIATAVGNVMAIEKLPYTVLDENGPFSLREYPAFIVAETTVEGAFEEVGSEGFRRLAAYINGENIRRQSIAMTAPVNQEARSEKIAMTAPVIQEKSGNNWRITFVMPASYSLATLPEPTDPRVVLVQEPGRRVAALRYSGTWGRKRYEDHEKRLLNWIADQGLKQTGEPIWARYDPPFMPWFLRRNEILIPVTSDRYE